MKKQIIDLIADLANRSANDFTVDATLDDDLGIDSMDLVLLQLELEDAFDIDLPDTAFTRCRKVQDIIDLVGQQLATH